MIENGKLKESLFRKEAIISYDNHEVRRIINVNEKYLCVNGKGDSVDIYDIENNFVLLKNIDTKNILFTAIIIDNHLYLACGK